MRFISTHAVHTQYITTNNDHHKLVNTDVEVKPKTAIGRDMVSPLKFPLFCTFIAHQMIGTHVVMHTH